MTTVSKEQEKIAETIQKLLELSDEDRETVIRIVRENHPKKIMVALENALRLSKHGKVKPRLNLKEFEEILKRTRF